MLKEFKNSLEDTDPVLRNMDANVPQKLNDDRDRSDQRSQEMEGLLGLALQAINKMEVKIQELSTNKAREEPKKALIVIMEDNLTKTKRALMAPKQLCPTGLNIQSKDRKNNIKEKDEATLTKLRETLIKKSKDYHASFPKYDWNSKQGLAVDYRVDTITAEHVKFAIYRAIEMTMRTRVLHLEPGTIGFNSFTPAEYLEEMLGSFMNTRKKGEPMRSSSRRSKG